MKEVRHQEFINRLSSRTQDPVLQKFIHQLFRELPYDDLASLEPDWLFTAAQSTLTLLRMPKQTARVALLKDQNNPDDIVLQVIHTDVPFLVESLSNELKQQYFEIQLIVHPALNVKRASDHTFISLSEEPTPNKEAVMQFYISKWLDDEQCKQLEKRIYEVLECVDLSVQDWLPMRGAMVAVSKLLGDTQQPPHTEIKEFLDWLAANNFIFLGYFESVRKHDHLVSVQESIKGIVSSKLYSIEPIAIDSQYLDDAVMFIRKWDSRSVVHRLTHMDWIVIKKFDQSGQCIGAYNFLGLFASTVYYQSVLTIPLIRIKIKNVIKSYGYPESSHNCKELVTALEAFPRGELLQMSEDELFETATGIVSLSLTPRVRLFVRQDRAEKFISCIIFLPRNRFSTDLRIAIEKLLCASFNATVSKQYVQINESQLVRTQLLLQTTPQHIPPYDVMELEEQIRQMVSAWSDTLYEMLARKLGKHSAKASYKRFSNAFDIKYTSTFSAKQAVYDIELIELALAEEAVQFDIYTIPGVPGETIQLKIYSPHKPTPLSLMLPKIENVGFKALDVVNYEIKVEGNEQGEQVYISHFRLFTISKIEFIEADLKDRVALAFYKIWENVIEDDRFNSLIPHASLNWREALLLRVYAKYLKQVNFPHDFDYIVDVLVKYPAIIRQLVMLFNHRFDPDLECDEEVLEGMVNDIHQALATVSSIAEEQVIKAYLATILATKRTNFFQLDSSGETKNYISLKMRSSEVLGMPQPYPYAETYIYCSTRFEGVHLRGGRVARGGIRWSDRPDFRTEVLGLMKAQMAKNAVIVPVGSKGGFLLKRVTPADGREAFMKEGIECYKLFLSGILDITDNVEDGKIMPPPRVVRHDDDDPYLVVAADKGTATFSDYANAVSASYNFWLGDAFASGGSAGYDHKKMAITARGAWLSVKHHFEALDINISTTPFTVVGIGDMAGDVFGNGMLLSPQIKLIGAFNHMHIFLDPNPDSASSFEERMRLFTMPRSQWSDYNAKLISEGGGIFERASKYIELSPQMADILHVQPGLITPDALIRALLKAPVDLLWNGGIGTYVKAEAEINEQMGDKANDALRINGKELRCKVVGEGGNLGMTQLGRIEYAKIGGCLNTDFIDNSAGVDCSDHEVNIKIAMNQLMRTGALKLAARNELLDSMTEEVGNLVLADNYVQNKLISCEEMTGNWRLSVHAWLIKYLEHKGELDRSIEYLPSAEAIAALNSEGQRLTRPEIAVLVAYAKNSAFKVLSTCTLVQDPYLHTDLLAYFPKVLQTKYKKVLLQHQLANEILVTVLVNEFINILGCTFFHQLLDSGYMPDAIIKAFVVVRDIFSIKEHWSKINALDGQVSLAIQVELLGELQRFTSRNIRWLLRHGGVELEDITSCIKAYSVGVNEIRRLCAEDSYKCAYAEGCDEEMLTAAPESIRVAIVQLNQLYQALDMVKVARNTKADIDSVATAYQAIGHKMHIGWILLQTRRYNAVEYVDKVALQAIVSEIEDLHGKLTAQVIAFTKEKAYCAVLDSVKLSDYSRFIGEMKASTSAWLGMLVLTVQRIRDFVED